MSKSKKKVKKTAPAGGKNANALPGERDEKRMDPLARRLLILDVILIAAAQLLHTAGFISDTADIVLTVLGLVLLLAALAIQGRSGSGGGARL